MNKKSLDIATIVGNVLIIGLVLYGIVSGTDENGNMTILFSNLSRFIDVNSIAIVIGGTFGALFVMFPLSQVGKILKHILILLMPNKYSPDDYIETLVEAAKKARVSGLLSLEETMNEINNTFFKNSMQMIVDSVDPEIVTRQMDSWMDDLEERHLQDCAFYDKGAALAPGFGMIGTLIGLINMLQNLTEIEKVGADMAVALITTFYGSLLANAFFSPISNKLKVRHDEELFCMRLISTGVKAIQEGENPNVINERLLHMLPEYKRSKLSKKMGTGEGAAE